MIEAFEAPNLNCLIAFESTVKHGSMTKAAALLGISQPLVSQRIRSLEESLGGTLVDRTKKPITPTAEGQKFYDQIRGPLAAILVASDTLRNDFHHTKTKISIGAYFGFAFHWLMPRLQRLQEAFPDYLFDILPTNSQADLFALHTDIVFHYAEKVGQYQLEQMFFHEEIFPVCSPQFAKANNLIPQQKLTDLSALPILHKDIDDARWPNWRGWAEQLGITPSKRPVTLRYNNYPLVVEAAMHGQGICLGWEYLVNQFVHDGKLIALEPRLINRQRGYQLCSNYASTKTVKGVIDWLMDENKRELSSTSFHTAYPNM